MFDTGVGDQSSGSNTTKQTGGGEPVLPTTLPPISAVASDASSIAGVSDKTTTTPQQQPLEPTPSLPPEPIRETPPVSQPTPPLPEPAIVPPAPVGQTDDGSTLMTLKQKALGELSPLVDKLDQRPQERFRTIMMLLQATDDSSLVDKAYEAAHAISEEKERAQALLDVVNEINYFTQAKKDSSDASQNS